MRRQAYTNTQLLSQLMEAVLIDEVLNDVQKAEILEKIAVYHLKDVINRLVCFDYNFGPFLYRPR